MDQKRDVVIIVVAAALLCSLSLSSAIQTYASFYTGSYTPSACFGNEDKGRMIAGVGNSMWNNGALCGKKLTISCIDEASNCKSFASTVQVTVVELCDDCGNSINLSEEAFDKIAKKEAGRVKINYVRSS